MKHTGRHQYISNTDNDELKINMEAIFHEVQGAIDTGDIVKLSQLFTSKFYNEYQKKPKKLFLNNDKIYIENIKVQDIANFKSNNDEVSVDIFFTATTYTVHDKNTVHWRVRNLATLLFPNKETGESTLYKQSFKQKWFFVYESQRLRVKKIKGVYLKQE